MDVTRRRLVSMLIVLLLVLAACSGGSGASVRELRNGLDQGGDSGRGTGTTIANSGEDTGAPGENSTATNDGLGDDGITPVVLPTDIGRDIIFTAEMTVAVPDVAAAGDEATRIIENVGGFLFGQRTTGDPNPTSVLTFKVQPADFQDALTRLGSIGEIRDQNVSASDVTDRIVDLESRIETSAASVERLRALLSEATDIKAIVELETELLARETELETLRGSLRTLRDQVALATISVIITEAASNPALTVGVTAYPAHDSGASCPGDAGLGFETGTEVTVCYELVNSGDTWLADFELRDPVLDLEFGDLVVVFGDSSVALEPGDSLILAAEVVPERDLRTRTTVSAQPVDEDGSEISGRPASQTESVLLDAVDPDGIPTFGAGLSASWDLLVNLGKGVVLVAAALIPFSWIPLILWLVWRNRRPVGPTGG